MKKLFVLLLLVVLVAGGYWLWDRTFGWKSPTESFEAMVHAAQVGDEAGFLAGFTEESAKVMRAYLALAKSNENASDMAYRKIVLSEVLGEQVIGDHALILAEYRTREVEIPMKRQDGRWRIDAFALEAHWLDGGRESWPPVGSEVTE